jgi:zona occludens toxin (predicted ATPase)
VRLPKELVVLLVLLAVMIIGVSWYVVDRRAKNRLPAEASPATAPAHP